MVLSLATKSNHVVQPLRGLHFNQWWFHGDIDQPPPPNAVTSLPARGKIDVEISGNKAFTSMGRGLLANSRGFSCSLDKHQ